MSTILHRLKRLFLEICDIDEAYATLLFGPVADWILSDRRATERAADMARTMATSDVHYAIALRMCAVYDLYRNCPKDVPDVAHMPYMVGVFMDIHVPALKVVCESVHDVYRKRVAPEHIRISQVPNDEMPIISASLMTRLWRGHATKKTYPQIVKSRKRAPRKPYKDIPVDTILPKHIPTPANEDCLYFILSKGMHGVSTTRNIAKHFNQALHTHVGKLMRVAYAVGAYRHAKVIAPPPSRVNVIMPAYKPIELKYIIAEFIAANTKHYVAYHRTMATTDERWRFFMQASVIADKQLRGRLYNVIYPKEPRPRRTLLQIDNVQLFWAIVDKLCARGKVKIALIRKAGKNLAALYDIMSTHPYEMRIYKSILLRLGMSLADTQALQHHLSFRLDRERTSKSASRAIAALSKHGRSILCLYVNYLVHRAQLSWHRIVDVRPIPQHKRDPKLHICGRCHTIRSQFRLTTPTPKVENGIAVNISNPSQLYCTDCYSDDIRSIDMRYHYVHGTVPGDPLRPCTLCMCHECGVITEYRFVINQNNYCRACYHEVSRRYVAKVCVCGRTVDKYAPPGTILVANEDDVVITGLCTQHTHLLGRCHPNDVMPLEFYAALI